MFKKFSFYCFSILIVFISSCTQECDCPEPEPEPEPQPGACLLPSLNLGLVAYFPFNGSAVDESGYSHNVIFNNATLTTDRNGKANKAYQFNGTDTYMRIANSVELNPQRISLCAIVKPTGFYKGRFHANAILYKGVQDQDVFNVYYLRFNEGIGSYPTDPNSSNVDTIHQVFNASFAGNTPPATSGPYIQKNKWYSVVYTFDGTVAKLYVDGTLVSSVTNSSPYLSSANDVFLGKTVNSTYPFWYNGAIDEVRIYNRALSISEVQSLGSACNTQ